MASVVTNKLLSNELKIEEFLEWLKQPISAFGECLELEELCSQKDYITYFLNTLHDLSSKDQLSESSIKSKLQNDSTENSGETRSLLNGSRKYNTYTQDSANFSQNTFDSSCTTSTPKQKRSSNNSSFAKEYSPIHTNKNNFKSTTPSNGTLCLGDFIVTRKSGSSKKKSNKKATMSPDQEAKKSVRKLKPTNLSESRFTSVDFKSGNTYNFQKNIEEVSRDDVQCDFMTREILTKNNLMGKGVPIVSDAVPGVKTNNPKNLNPKNVRYKEEIKKIVDIYEFLLKNGFVLSLVGELYFVINLLSGKCSCDTKECDLDSLINVSVTFESIFDNVENISFFACASLEKMSYLLKSFDKTTLRYLCDNEVLRIFAPHLLKKLETVYEEKAESNLNLYSFNGKNNICFVLETDNQSNFPSEKSFQGFKKQRDMFYEILRLWEDNHMQPNWDFEMGLGKKVRTLVSYHMDSVNFMRLSRLFMEQLLNACSKKGGANGKNSDALSSLSNLDKEKIDRLKNRLTKKPTNGINSVPDFCGYQEFFRDFILYSSSPIFIRHLCNVFIAEIIELNGTTFDTLDTESDDSETEFDTKKAFVSCLKSLKTLAKFLGFVEAMPYKNDNIHSQELMEFQIKIRNQVTPILNIRMMLQDSISSGTLTLFIPWLCEYLSMLDVVTLQTKYYTEVIEIMMNLYRCVVRCDKLFPFYNFLLVTYSLGWFFELSNFPHNVFFEKLMSNDDNKMMSRLKKNKGHDRLSLVDHNMLYYFCPFLEEFRKLLTNETAVKDRVTSRHITPLSKVDSPKQTIKKKIEVQLEETFFNSHPSSLKKTVEFIAERVASVCVKHLCHQFVPDFKKSFVGVLQTHLKQWISEEKLEEGEWRSRCTKLTEEQMVVLKASCDEEVNKIIQERVRVSVVPLLPMDTLPQIQNICVGASERICREKVQQWVSTHIVIGLLTKEVKSEIRYRLESYQNTVKAKPSYLLPPSGNGLEHESATESGAHILNKIRFITGTLITRPQLQEETIIKALNDVFESITRRNDNNEMVIKMLGSHLVDLMVFLICRQPSTVLKTKENFLHIWKLIGEKAADLFENLVSVKNFIVIAKSSCVEKSLHAKAVMCSLLVQEELLPSHSFESQCMGLFRYELEDHILKAVTFFLRDFVDVYKNQCKSSKFTFLLEFLSDFCTDL